MTDDTSSASMLSTLFSRATDDTAHRPVDAPWPVQDIIYVAVVGGVMLAALLEWILWLLAMLYCFVKTFQKAEGENRWSVRILSVVNGVFFIAMRCIFLPIMVVTLPLPAQVTQYFPPDVRAVLQLFAFYSFAGLLTIPWLFCVYQLVTHNVGRTRRIKTVLDEYSAPKVVIIMPCYNEAPVVLLRTVDSIVDCEYPPSCMHIFLSFDGDQENELYLKTIDKLGVPLTLDSYPKSIDIAYRSCRVTVSRFPHGGKRSCQKKTYKLIDKVYAEYLRRNDNLFLLFIDSDCILDKVCIQNFMYEMELKPGSRRNMLAMTGVITSTTEKNTLITVLQDMEYIHGQLFERSVESACGAVTCLPGALTILRFSAFRRMAKYYFADKAEQCDDLFDYGKCHLGEDRWLTHLFMIGAKERYQIQMNTGAFCKTEAVQTYKSLLKQRRRWFLGFITNEVCMLTDIRLWKRYPILLMIRLAQNTIRTTALLFFIMVISILTTAERVSNLPVGFIAVSLGLNWILMLYFGARLGRYKIMLYPVMFVLNPFFNWVYMVYGIFTAGQRTWGGPRADAGKADEHTTPSQAIEQAEKTGNELNVVPETFKPAIEATTDRPTHRIPLQPSGLLEGRFAPARELPGGWFQQANDSGVLRSDLTPRQAEEMYMYRKGQIRDSLDSLPTSQASATSSIYIPRRVESIFEDDDTRAYHDRQAGQRPAGGAFFESSDHLQRLQMAQPRAVNGTVIAHPTVLPSGEAAATRLSISSMRSSDSDSSVSLHFGVPERGRQRRISISGMNLSSNRRARTDSHSPSPQTSPSRPSYRPGEHNITSHPPTSSSSSSGPSPKSSPPSPNNDNVATFPPHPQADLRQGQAPTYPGSSSKRTGQSPLARKSFTRIASPVSDQDDEQDSPTNSGEKGGSSSSNASASANEALGSHPPLPDSSAHQQEAQHDEGHTIEEPLSAAEVIRLERAAARRASEEYASRMHQRGQQGQRRQRSGSTVRDGVEADGRGRRMSWRERLSLEMRRAGAAGSRRGEGEEDGEGGEGGQGGSGGGSNRGRRRLSKGKRRAESM